MALITVTKTTGAQVTTDSEVVLDGSVIDARQATSVAMSVTNSGANSITCYVYAANNSDFTGEVIVGAAAGTAVAASTSTIIYSGGGTATATTGVASHAYYRIKIKATAGGSQGTATGYITMKLT